MSVTLPAGSYFGKKRAQVRFDDLILSDLAYAQDAAFPQHAHENAYMAWVLHGMQIEKFKGGGRRYERGILTLHPAHQIHYHETGRKGLRCLNVEFGTKWVAANPHVQGVLKKPAYLDTNRFPSIALMAKTIYTEFCNFDDVSALAIEGSMLLLLSEVSRSTSLSSKTTPHWLKKVRDSLHDSFAEPLSLKVLSASVDVHPVHLARAFHKHYRCTVANYIRRLRINSACEAIDRSEASLSQIALDNGFADQAHFTRAFKQMTGVTPGQFRKHKISR